METAEEQAEKHETLQSVNEWVVYHEGYAQGYLEAMLWRDPSIERPDYYKKVAVKYQRDDSKIDYACVALLADDDGAYFFGDYYFAIIIDFDKVIGWRPIE